MSFVYATHITRLRQLADDAPKANYAAQETPGGKRDSSNVLFWLAHRNVVASSIYLTSGATVRTQSGFTPNEVDGFITFASAPTGNETPWYVAYFWQWATDADYTEYLDEALGNVGVLRGGDPAEGLLPAIYQFALSAAMTRRAIEYARRYQATGGIAGQQVDVVTNNFRMLAKDAWARATDLLRAFSDRQGRKLAPSSRVIQHRIDPYTPGR